jgi:Protein of unknown function (DUF2992)
MNSQLTVFFDGQFWVAVIEIQNENSLRSARYVFSQEPSDPEILAWVQSAAFMRFLEDVDSTTAVPSDLSSGRGKTPNPKRALRIARRAMLAVGPSSKADEAMRLNREANKKQRKSVSAAERAAEEERQFLLRRQRTKARHRGH